jgi:diguanylate cyclase (GGDEF)-like protein
MSSPSRVLDAVARQPRWLMLLVAAGWTLAIGLLDALTGARITLSFFYMLPLALVAWTAGRTWGTAYALMIAAVWYAADAVVADEWVSSVAVWNAIVRLAILVFVAFVVALLRETLDREALLARQDPQTGLANALEFRERAAAELARLARCGVPLTVAYCDVDALKAVNDIRGHEAGDRVLATVAAALRGSLRGRDMVARLGGDEFAVLLPDTADEAALAALSKALTAVREALGAVAGAPSLSIGAVWTRLPVSGLDCLLREADARLYMVKANGKDGLLLTSVDVPPNAAAIRRSAHSTDRMVLA